MATNQPGAQGASSSASSQSSGASNGGAAKAGRKPRDPNAIRKASPKVKALNEVRTYMIQHREQVLSGKTGVERDIESERFERMLDAVEALFPPGHSFTIKRAAAATTQPATGE